MNKNYDIIKEEFNLNKYISIDKIKACLDKKSTEDLLNKHELNILKNNISYTFLSYSTKNIYDLLSYYIIEFNKKGLLDIIEIRVLKDLQYKGSNRYINCGFKFIDALTMQNDKDKNNKVNIVISTIINNYLKKYEGIDDIENFDHPDSIIQVIIDGEKHLYEI